jgi:hypothetical protein
MQNASRTRQAELATNAYVFSKPVPWHEEPTQVINSAISCGRDEIPEIISHRVAALPQPPNSEAATHRGR